MKTLVSMTLAGLIALPAYAGDQPVIPIAVPTKYYEIDYFFGSPVRPEVRILTGVTGAPSTVANGVASPAGSGVVRGADLSQRDSAALYDRLLAEARARGLR